MTGIPKIVHHIAPEDNTNWHPIWTSCYETWKKHFPVPEYQHVMWNDKNDLDIFMKTHYSWAYEAFLKVPLINQKIDIARICILHKFGGIYSDMDFYCLSNFYNKLDASLTNVVEHPPEFVSVCRLQGSLMASPPNSEYLTNAIKLVVERVASATVTDIQKCIRYNFGGPGLLSDVLDMFPEQCNILHNLTFNPIISYEYDSIQYNESTCVSKHLGTGSYAPDSIDRWNKYLAKQSSTVSQTQVQPQTVKKLSVLRSVSRIINR
jgi:hypothetical protein